MRKSSFYIFTLTILVLNCCILTHLSIERSRASVLKSDIYFSESFREQDMPPSLYKELSTVSMFSSEQAEILTTTMLNGDFHPRILSTNSDVFLKYKKEEYLNLQKYYEAIWNDLKFFPVADSHIYFEDSWMSSRTYLKKKHYHEGTDLFGEHTEPGFYPIVSITDGTVEQKGWIPLGGYRIGIRSTSGGYFYYAHLDSYEKDFMPGDSVCAGDILGYMGNTGYEEEGTVGNFPVHLHLGIYITVSTSENLIPGGASDYTPEISVNPFSILRYLRKNIRNYTYS